ncbi:MAG TPA: hypothetical protein VHD15_13875 [Hyphomicrobiales bacterium]|nr:hypothetical protein [Hyphomicrobiales bacterium]
MLASLAAPPRRRRDAWPRAAARTGQAAALLAGSVLLDSAMEHFRGSYANPAMYLAPATATATLAAAIGRDSRRLWRPVAFLMATAVGSGGLGFHAYNILKRPGGLSWNNLFYAAPIGAPGALALSGILGLASLRLKRLDAAARRRHDRLGAGRALGGLTAAGLLATVGEVGLLHFRGAYHNPLMVAPVTLPPIAAGALAAASVAPTPQRIRLARGLLRATAALGFAGVALHAWGVQRNMGGWRNWSQNLFAGPPIPAPPSFTGLALAGLGALALLDRGSGARHRG